MEHYQQIVETLENARDERGIPKAELARRAKVDNRRLMFALCGKRQMHVDEFVRVCCVLEMPKSRMISSKSHSCCSTKPS